MFEQAQTTEIRCVICFEQAFQRAVGVSSSEGEFRGSPENSTRTIGAIDSLLGRTREC